MPKSPTPSGGIVVHPDPVTVGGTVDIEGFYLPADTAVTMTITDAAGAVTTPCQTNAVGQVFVNGVTCNTVGTSLVEFHDKHKRALAAVEFQVV